MNIFYEGKDITESIDLRKAEVIDKAGNELDSIEIQANDPEGLWSKWKPEKNHRIEIENSGLTSGEMYLDEIGQTAGTVILKALPIKQAAKQSNSQGWDDITFLELAQEIAGRHGLKLKTYGITNYRYKRINQIETSDFSFLAKRCILEGFVLKISGGCLIIYDEKTMENQPAAKTIYLDDFNGNFSYLDKATEIYGGCKLTYGDIQYEFSAPGIYGPTLKINQIPVHNVGEAKRYCSNLTRGQNKFEKTLICSIASDGDITAGNTVDIKGSGIGDAKYFVYEARHKFLDGKIALKLRQIPEGY